MRSENIDTDRDSIETSLLFQSTDSSRLFRVDDVKPDRVPLIGIEIASGYTQFNLYTFFYASMVNVAALVYINGALPYILTTFLHIPEDEQGTRTGDIGLYNEIAIIIVITLWGILSDKIGRKIVYIVGFLFMAVGIFLHPFATSFSVLVVYRIIFAVGAAASVAMLTSLLGDYPTDAGRGRTGGVMGVTSGLGALTGLFLFLQIPKWANLESSTAGGEIMYWCMSGWLLVSAVILAVGLSGATNVYNKHENFMRILVDGTLAAKDPRVALAYLSSFAARGDSVVLTSLLSLWINQFELKHGASSEEAIAQAGIISGVCQTVALVTAPLFGFLSDKFDRLLCQMIAAIVAAFGYLFLFFIDDPRGVAIYIAICIVGIGEIGMVVSSQILLATVAPEPVRGAVSGLFGLTGSISVLVSTKLGGYLFDNWTETGPFLLVAIYNMVVFLFGTALYLKERWMMKDR